MSRKIVGGRMKKELDESVLQFLSGKDIIYDRALIPYDILGNIAHNLMLHKIGALSSEEVKQIVEALKEIYTKWENGEFKLLKELEDVHMNIEYTVTTKIGQDIGGKMHLARSRNDQVLVDLRLYMRDEIIEIQKLLLDLIESFIQKAEGHKETIYIAYTHLQQAQPITFAHWCMAHADTLFRDLERLSENFERVNMNPLGAGAIAGTSWPIDRAYTTKLLGFKKVQENTLDVISSRGEAEAELVGSFALLMLHLGRIAEDIVLATTSEFGYLQLDDQYCTGSSIMPHKKNPDVVELIRARTGSMNGNLLKILGILKGLPSGYNRDHQEIKTILFPSIKMVKETLTVLKGLILTMKLNNAKINEKIKNNLYLTATELVDLLIQEWNIPFRSAYTIISNYFKVAPSQKSFNPETLADFLNKETVSKGKRIALEKIKKALDPLETIKKRSHLGGPAPNEEQRMIVDRIHKLKKERARLTAINTQIEETYKKLINITEEII
ncbi:MAG: argininosuccinate lyase [Candidatus Helarchaeota archaeon]